MTTNRRAALDFLRSFYSPVTAAEKADAARFADGEAERARAAGDHARAERATRLAARVRTADRVVRAVGDCAVTDGGDNQNDGR